MMAPGRSAFAPASERSTAAFAPHLTPDGSRARRSAFSPARDQVRPHGNPTTATVWRTEVTARLGEPPSPPRRILGTGATVEPVPCHVLATSVTPRITISKEPGAAQHVHCPSLSSCHDSCGTVHFGYAIPVLIGRGNQKQQHQCQGQGCEVVFDNGADLDPRAARFLLEHHPQLSRNPEQLPMHLAPSVKQQSQPDGGTKMAVDPNELYNQLMRQNAAEHDIQAIAKQISDHAEAIYQTWKSKGLTPNELLHLHSAEAPPTSPQHQVARVPTASSTTPSPVSSNPVSPSASMSSPRPAQRLSTVELLANPQLEATLEQLVNSFVQEDKARVAAAARSRTASPSATAAAASTIQAALKRFESRGVSPSRPLDGDLSVKTRAAQFTNRMERSTSPTPWKRPTEPKTVVTEVTHQVAAAAAPVPSLNVKSEIEKEEEKLINALKTGQVIEVPGSSEHFLMAKKIRERLQQQRRSVPSGANAEKELDTLVDRLKTMEPRREGSPALLNLREGSPSRSTSPRSVKLSETVPISGVSNVDYAKVRYQAAQANPLTQQRLEDVKNFSKTPQPNLVSETRTRFEGPTLLLNSRVTNNVPIPWRAPTPPADSAEQPVQASSVSASSSESNLEALRRLKNRKLRKSPEPPSQINMASIPHPELTQQQKQHLRERSLQQMAPATSTPIRPFLTRGSVAERVLLFEKCPAAVANEGVAGFYHHAKATERTTSSGAARSATATVTTTATATTVVAAAEKPSTPRPSTQPEIKKVVKQEIKIREPEKQQPEQQAAPPPGEVVRAAAQRPAKAALSGHLPLPRFYFPTGRPLAKEQLDGCLHRLAAAFQQVPGQRASREHFGLLAKACGCPLYWKSILYIASGGESSGHVTQESFLDFWKKMITNYHDEASRFVRLLTMINPNSPAPNSTNNNNGSSSGSNGIALGNNSHGRTFLVPEDFVPLIQDVVDTHPGLTFLKEAAEFHSRYVHTVIARIFYNVNRSWSGQISLAELRHSNLLATIRVLEDEEDINQITDYFSYEHFYVIYCKFWELDKDHDLFIDKKDLARHNDHALSSKIIDRIFSGAVTRGVSKLMGGVNKTPNNPQQPRMSYTEFVWFLISEEDKRHPTAIEYWFRCMDLDGDGYLSMYELEYFYEEQLQRMESLGIETLPFEDCLCQMLDMIHPAVAGKVSLNDLKRCQMTPIFFDTFFNLEKYLDHEQRDPFASQRDPDSENGEETHKLSDWDRYAAEEYELLVAEEGGPDQNDDMYMRDDVATPDADNDRDVIMSEDGADYSHLRPLFSVTPCAVEYHY